MGSALTPIIKPGLHRSTLAWIKPGPHMFLTRRGNQDIKIHKGITPVCSPEQDGQLQFYVGNILTSAP